MEKISVDAFLREYNVAAKQKGTAVETFIKKHIVKKNIPYLEKLSDLIHPENIYYLT